MGSRGFFPGVERPAYSPAVCLHVCTVTPAHAHCVQPYSCTSVCKLVCSVDESFLVIPIDAIILLVVYWLFVVPLSETSTLALRPRQPVRALRQASCRPLTVEAQFRPSAIPREVCGGQIGTGTGFSPSTSVFPYHYHSTNAPYSPSS